MKKMTNTLSRMAMAVPITVAAPVALASVVTPQPAAARGGAAMTAAGTQWHLKQLWRASCEGYGRGYRESGLSEGADTGIGLLDRVRRSCAIGIVPSHRMQDGGHGAWHVDAGNESHLSFADYGDGWGRKYAGLAFVGSVSSLASGAAFLLAGLPDVERMHIDNGEGAAALDADDLGRA